MCSGPSDGPARAPQDLSRRPNTLLRASHHGATHSLRRGARTQADSAEIVVRPVTPHVSSPRRAIQSSLGYEHYDVRLPCLGRSPATVLTSGNPFRGILSGSPRLRCLAQSRRVRFTYWFTEPVLGLRIPVLRRDVTSSCQGMLSAVHALYLRAELLHMIRACLPVSVAVSRDCYSDGYSPPGLLPD